MAWSSDIALSPLVPAPPETPARAAATVHLLLVSANIQTIEAVCETIQQLTIHVEICRSVELAQRKLARAKYEGVIVDVESAPAALDLIRSIRLMTSHVHCVSYAIVTTTQNRKAALEAGANFAVEWGLPNNNIGRVLRASYALLVREKRRYFRHPVRVPVSAKGDSGRTFEGETVNISEGGMALQSASVPAVGEKLSLRLQLPQTNSYLNFYGEVCWNNAQGIAGIEFAELGREVRDELNRWLSNRLSELVPLHSGNAIDVLRNCQAKKSEQRKTSASTQD